MRERGSNRALYLKCLCLLYSFLSECTSSHVHTDVPLTVFAVLSMPKVRPLMAQTAMDGVRNHPSLPTPRWRPVVQRKTSMG